MVTDSYRLDSTMSTTVYVPKYPIQSDTYFKIPKPNVAGTIFKPITLSFVPNCFLFSSFKSVYNKDSRVAIVS